MKQQDKQPEQTVWRLWVERVGLGFLLLIAFAVPLAVFPWLLANEAILVGKRYLLTILAAGAMTTGAFLSSVRPIGNFFRGRTALTACLLVAFLAWGLLSALFSESPRFSLLHWLPVLMTGGAALTGPLFLSRRSHSRLLLYAILLMAVIFCFIGVVSGLGFRGFNRAFYNMDPRDIIEQTDSNMRVAAYEGGPERAAAQSTLGNPEYSGTLAAVLAALGAVFLLDWAPRSRRPWLMRAGSAILIAGLILMLLFSGTRQGWIVLGLAALFRLALALRTPPWAIALGLALPLAAGLVVGLIYAVAIFALALVVLLGWGIAGGRLIAAFRSAAPFNRFLAAGVPALGIIAVLAFSTPGPWNPIGTRVLQRFTSLTDRNDRSVRERLLFYMLASRITRESPVLGAGPGFFGPLFYPTLAELVDEDPSAHLVRARQLLGNRFADKTHNDYLQLAAETGFVGLALFLAFLASLLEGLIRLLKREDTRLLALAYLVGIFSFLIVMLTSFPLHTGGRMAVFWMLIAGSLGLLASSGFQQEAPAEETP